MRKSVAERTVESLTWALVVIWLGVMLIAGGLQYAWLVMMVLGIILLTSAIYQHMQGWETSYAIWIFGVWMAVFSVVELADELIAAANEGKGLGIDLGVYLGIALISMGVATMLRMIRGAGTGANTQGGRPPEGTYAPDYAPTVAPTIRPRVVQDETGTGVYGPHRYRPASPAGYDAPTWDNRQQGTRETGSGYAPRTGASTARARSADAYEEEYDAYDRHSSPPRYGEERAPLYGDTEYDAFGDDYDDLIDDPDELPQMRYSRHATRRQRPAPQSEETNELASRVEDIIQKSRKRREVGPQDLAEDFIRRAQWDPDDEEEDLPY